jgi:peptidoglycan/xylan/chitin deacetylase (PgdA/CDA1 family)
MVTPMQFLFASFFLICTQFLNAKEIALSFDDAPRPSTFLRVQQRCSRLIEALQSNSASAIFFANSVRVTGEGKSRVERYADAGFLFGNHTHSHPDFNSTTASDFEHDFLQAHAEFESTAGFVKWFRFPFLREGDTREKRNRMRRTLKSYGYRNAYVTVNNYDWYMDVLFQRAAQEKRAVNMEALKKTYVQVLKDSVHFYDKMAHAVLGRSPKHVLLLHENDLAALFLSDLISALRADGWKMISPDEAYTDQIARYQTKQTFYYNPGRIGEIASDRGWSADRKTGRLWDEACNEVFLEKLFLKNGVYE